MTSDKVIERNNRRIAEIDSELARIHDTKNKELKSFVRRLKYERNELVKQIRRFPKTEARINKLIEKENRKKK